ncbi:hypothetical protein ACRAWG_23850 [Methylobacterium sp. P31]
MPVAVTNSRPCPCTSTLTIRAGWVALGADIPDFSACSARQPGAPASAILAREDVAEAGAPGCDRTTVAASGAVRATSGWRSRPGATSTATLCFELAARPSLAVMRRRISLGPAGSAGGTMANCPLASAVARATGLPSRSISTSACGAPRPATTVSPFGSTRTMSKRGASAASSLGRRRLIVRVDPRGTGVRRRGRCGLARSRRFGLGRAGRAVAEIDGWVGAARQRPGIIKAPQAALRRRRRGGGRLGPVPPRQPPQGFAAEQGQHEAEAAEKACERQGETAPHLSRHRHNGLL